MNDIQKWQLIIALVSLAVGGLGGAVFTFFMTAYRNRIQPVGCRKEKIPILKPPADQKLNTKIVVTEGTNQHQFQNLFLCSVNIVNKGNQDIGQFKIDLTLEGDDVAIFAEVDTPDRSHIAKFTPPSPSVPKKEIDFELVPFNRDKLYVLKVYVVIPDGKFEPNDVKVSSPHPIKLTDMPSLSELVAQTIEITALSLGPVKLSLLKP